MGVIGLSMVLVMSFAGLNARQDTGVAIDNDDIGGVVTSERGPEAGVWVIAETTDLSTKFIRTVVTDEAGRYLLPDLPPVYYRVWVRGYGLVDSPKVITTPGKNLDLTAIVAPNQQAALSTTLLIIGSHYWSPQQRATSLGLAPAVTVTQRC